MFKIKQKLDNLYDLIISLNNNERQHSKSVETMMNNYKEDSIRLTARCENAKEVLKEKDILIEILNKTIAEQDVEIQRLTKIIEDDKKFKEDIKEYLKTVAQIATNVQKTQLSKKISAVAYTRNNMTEEAKAKLK